MFQVEQDASSVGLEVDPAATTVSHVRAADSAIEKEPWSNILKLVSYLGQVIDFYSNLVFNIVLLARSYTTERIFWLS